MNRFAQMMILVLPLAVACGGGGPETFGAPTCGNEELVIEGSVGGETVSDSRQNFGAYSFTPGFGGSTGSLTISLGLNESLSMEWEGAALPNIPVAARGSLDLAAGGGIEVTFCDAVGFTGEFLAPDPENEVQGEFRLVDLRTSEPGCAMPSAGGEIVGCFRPEVQPPQGGN